MLPLIKAQRHKLVSESAGLFPNHYLFDFQNMRSGMLSHSFYPTVLRENDMKKETEVEPIGEKTSIPNKHFRWQPNRYDMYSVWDLDGPDGPGQDDGPEEHKPGVEQTVDADKPMQTQEPVDAGPMKQANLREAARRETGEPEAKERAAMVDPQDELEEPKIESEPAKVYSKPSFAVISNDSIAIEQQRFRDVKGLSEKDRAAALGYTQNGSMWEKTLGVDYSNAKYGYVLKRKSVCLSMGDKPIEITSAHNMDGHYIGDHRTAKYLCEELCIRPVLASKDNRVCSIGKSQKDGKWYGWSHRAIYGFTPGSHVKPGDCAYKPNTREEAQASLERWHSDEGVEDANPKNSYTVKFAGETENGFDFRVNKTGYHSLTVENPSPDPVYQYENVENVPKGRGTWTAESEDDARQMAMDFAESVSVSIVDPDMQATASTLDFVSESKADKNVADYGWYRYSGTRAKKYNNHHRSIDLEIENGEKFGIRYSPRTKSVMLVYFDLLTEEFKLSEREAKLLIKNSKPFGGQVNKIKVTRGDGTIEQFSKRTGKRAEKHARPETVEKKPESVKVARDKRDGATYYFGFFCPSINQPEKWAFVVDDTVANTKRTLDKFMAQNKSLGSKAKVVRLSGKIAQEMLEKLGKRRIAYIQRAIVPSIEKKGRVVAKDYLPKNVKYYDEGAQVPHYNESTFRPVEPVYSGNEDAVLAELHDAVTREGYFTGIFRAQTGDKAKKLVRRVQGRPFVVFTCRTVNKKMIQEAENFVKRVKGVYGKAITGKVMVGEKDAGRDAPKIVVTLIMNLKKASPDQQKRSETIHQLFKNSQLRQEIGKKYSRIYEDMVKEKDGNRKMQLRKQLEKLSNESAKAKSLAFETPMYTTRSGAGEQVVEVMDLDIPKGQLIVRSVRARGMSGNRAVTNLWTYDGSIQIV
jgi:hypothetical protein